MSKFRARQLDASKPISIYLQEDITDINEYNNVTNRTVPQLPTGMEKEEETEHHLQQAIFHQSVIPVPEVYDTTKAQDGFKLYERMYPSSYKIPRQMIHIHPFSADQDIPDYDIDSEDEQWLQEHARKGELLPLDVLQFEEMMDRLEKASGLKALTLQEAKLLLKDDDDLITAVYDYWLNKRLKLQHPLIPQVRKVLLLSQVRTEKCAGQAPTDPYVAFRKRTEKMQTRKNRKNDEASYEKMLKLRRDLLKAVTLLEMVKRREKSKRELLHLNIEVFEKRNEMEDFSGSIYEEIASEKLQDRNHRPIFPSLLANHQVSSSNLGIPGSEGDDTISDNTITHSSWRIKGHNVHLIKKKEEGKRERRPPRRKRKVGLLSVSSPTVPNVPSYTHPPDPYSITSYSQDGLTCLGVSEDEVASHSEAEEEALLDGPFAFRRKALVNYHRPRNDTFSSVDGGGVPSTKGGKGDPYHPFSLTSVLHPNRKCIGLAKRRVGRGGRVWLDRTPFTDDQPFNCDIINSTNCDINDLGHSNRHSAADNLYENIKIPHYHPASPADSSEESEDMEVDVETVAGVPSTLTLTSKADSLNSSYSKESSVSESQPSSVMIMAEIMDGMNSGAFTHLQVSLPSTSEELDSLFVPDSIGNTSLVLEENGLEDVDILSTECSASCENSSVSNSGKVSQHIVTTSQSDILTSGSSVISEHHSGDLLESDNYNSVSNKLTSVHSGSTTALNSQASEHSSLEFQTLPSSRFFTSDNSSSNYLSESQNFRPLGSVLSNELEYVVQSSNVSNSSSQSVHSSSVPSSSLHGSYNNSIVKSNSLGNVLNSSSSTSSSNSLLTSTSSLLSTHVSSSLATSLSNNFSCASQNSLSKTNNDIQDSSSSKKLANHSSIQFRQLKDNLHLQVSNNLNNKNNGNSVTNNTNSNLVSQKMLSLWTSDNYSDESNALTNGPTSKVISKPKCTKVTQIIFPET